MVTKNRDRTMSVPRCGVQICQSATGGRVSAPDLSVFLRSRVGGLSLPGSPFLGPGPPLPWPSFSEALGLVRASEGPAGPLTPVVASSTIGPLPGAQARHSLQGDLWGGAWGLLFPGTKDRNVILISPIHMWPQDFPTILALGKRFPGLSLLQAQGSPFHAGAAVSCSSPAPTLPWPASHVFGALLSDQEADPVFTPWCSVLWMGSKCPQHAEDQMTTPCRVHPTGPTVQGKTMGEIPQAQWALSSHFSQTVSPTSLG